MVVVVDLDVSWLVAQVVAPRLDPSYVRMQQLLGLLCLSCSHLRSELEVVDSPARDNEGQLD